MRRIKAVIVLAVMCMAVTAFPCFAQAYTDDITVIGQNLRQAALEHSESKNIYYKSTVLENVGKIGREKFTPEFFVVTENPYEGDYLKRLVSDISYSRGDYVRKANSYYHYLITVNMKYNMELEKQQAVEQYVNDASSEMGLTYMDTDYYKVKTIYDRLISAVKYNDNLSESTPYDAAFGESSSEGIACLTYAMLKNEGIETRIVSSDNHIWNIVKIDDSWYNLDVSLDSISEEISYFLIDDETIAGDKLHTRDKESQNLDSCTGIYETSFYDFDIGIMNVPQTGKLEISWRHMPGVTEYMVYRSTKPDVTDIENDEPYLVTDKTNFVDEETTAGKKYYYTVVAGGQYISPERFRCTDLAAPVAKSKLSSGNIKVSWGKVKGAKKYFVYRSKSPDVPFKYVKTTTSRYYIHKKPAKGVTYYYMVKASNGNPSATSDYSNMAYRTRR